MQGRQLFIFVALIICGTSIQCLGQSVQLVPVDLSAGNVTDTRDDSKMRAAAARIKIDPNDASLSKWFRVASDGNAGFFLFYNNIQVTGVEAAFAVQTVTRTIETIDEKGNAKTEVRKLVEAFKLQNGRLKSPDQHFGSFSLGGLQKKSMIKEVEVGIVKSIGGKEYVPGEWPWEQTIKYKSLHGYDDAIESAPSVEFIASKKWKFSFEVRPEGEFELHVPELDIEFQVRNPSAPVEEKKGEIKAEEAPQLIPGSGVDGLVVIKKTSVDEIIQAYGEPVERAVTKNGATNVLFSNGLAAHFERNGKLTTLTTGEHNKATVRVGTVVITNSDGIAAIIHKLGEPKMVEAQYISYDGLIIWRSDDRVIKFVVH